MDRGPSLTRPAEIAVTQPPPAPDGSSGDSLAFAAASQAQISMLNLMCSWEKRLTVVRAHQRDSSQIHRLTELTSELLRSLAGW